MVDEALCAAIDARLRIVETDLIGVKGTAFTPWTHNLSLMNNRVTMIEGKTPGMSGPPVDVIALQMRVVSLESNVNALITRLDTFLLQERDRPLTAAVW